MYFLVWKGSGELLWYLGWVILVVASFTPNEFITLAIITGYGLVWATVGFFFNRAKVPLKKKSKQQDQQYAWKRVNRHSLFYLNVEYWGLIIIIIANAFFWGNFFTKS